MVNHELAQILIWETEHHLSDGWTDEEIINNILIDSPWFKDEQDVVNFAQFLEQENISLIRTARWRCYLEVYRKYDLDQFNHLVKRWRESK